MEISATLAVCTAGFVAVVVWTWRVLDWVWLRPKRLEKYLNQQGLQGTPYKFLVGDVTTSFRMLEEAKSRPISLGEDISARALPFPFQVMEKYGKNCYTWMGPVPRVMLTNPEAIKEVFSKINDFHKTNVNPFIRSLIPGLPVREGDKWAKHRKILNPAFHQEKLQNMLPAFVQSCSGMIKMWEEMASTERASCQLDIWPYLASMTSDAISRSAFGSSFEEGKRIFQLQEELSKLAFQAIKTLFIPGWRYVPTQTNRRMKQISQQIKADLKQIIEKRERVMQSGESPKDDLLGILLESNSRQSTAQGMSIEEVIEECQVFYFGGQETTAVLLAWTLVLLAHHNNWQSEAREEVLRVFGKENPDFDGLNHLKVVTMILYEVLRFYPPVVQITRAVAKETKLRGITLPAGVHLSIPILLVHRDPELWGPDASEFKPERFAEGVSKATKNRVSFIPFAWGPRICIGQNFSLIEAKMALTLILQKFWFELSSSYTHAPSPVVALRPQFGVDMILHKL